MRVPTYDVYGDVQGVPLWFPDFFTPLLLKKLGNHYETPIN